MTSEFKNLVLIVVHDNLNLSIVFMWRIFHFTSTPDFKLLYKRLKLKDNLIGFKKILWQCFVSFRKLSKYSHCGFQICSKFLRLGSSATFFQLLQPHRMHWKVQADRILSCWQFGNLLVIKLLCVNSACINLVVLTYWLRNLFLANPSVVVVVFFLMIVFSFTKFWYLCQCAEQ